MMWPKEKADKAGNAHAKGVIKSWAEGRMVHQPPRSTRRSLTITVLQGAPARPIPTTSHRRRTPGAARTFRCTALAMLKNTRADAAFKLRRKKASAARCRFIAGSEEAKGNLVAYVGDVVGTGSSHANRPPTACCGATGEDIPFVPNKRFGGVCLGSKIAPIFFNTHGRLPAPCRSNSTSRKWTWATPLTLRPVRRKDR